MSKTNNPKLRRRLGLPLLAMYGLGNILGAGIYVLVGKVAGEAGASTTLAFLLAMILAAVTAFSYMELSGRYPVSAGVSIYLHKAFGKRWLSVLFGGLIVAAGVASAAALAQGFAGYLQEFVAVPTVVASVGLIAVLGAITLKGIGESAKTAALFTAVEILGLLIVIWVGRQAFGEISPGDIVTLDPTLGFGGLIAGTFLAFYAFIGFEDMVNVAEEAKNPRRTMPLAILIALASATLLYLLVVIVSTHIVPISDLARSKAPLSLVFERSGAGNAVVLGVIGMVATMNGVIVQLIMGARVLYGLGKQGWIPRRFSSVSRKTNTPVFSTLLIIGVMILGTVLLPLISLAKATSMLVLIIFTMVNLSLIVIKRRQPIHRGYITIPVVIPYIGLVLSVAIIGYQLIA